jgi:hypothetical protein
MSDKSTVQTGAAEWTHRMKRQVVLNANAAIISLDRASKNPLSFLTDDFKGQSRAYLTTNSIAQREKITIAAVKGIEATEINI